MKARLALLTACSFMLISGVAYAGCCGGDSGCSSDDWCDQYGYQRVRSNDCECAADPGWRWNDCMSKCEYCEAFGNAGAR